MLYKEYCHFVIINTFYLYCIFFSHVRFLKVTIVFKNTCRTLNELKKQNAYEYKANIYVGPTHLNLVPIS